MFTKDEIKLILKWMNNCSLRNESCRGCEEIFVCNGLRNKVVKEEKSLLDKDKES